ncbi:MAG TPA: hypothetical protein VG456_13305 [Candidatus Sulfopaludibacter sp.]|nr:hypothetical protein [Candidatus Sulfopaludibacter sp.]
MEPNAPPSPVIPPLPYFTPDNLRELEAAKKGARKVKRAVFVANFDGWTIAIFGAITLAMGMSDATNIVLSLALGAVAYVELRNAARLKRLQPDAARTLGFNQLALATILIIYALWQIHTASRSGGTAAVLGVSDPGVAQMLGSDSQLQDLTQMAVHALYGALILIAICAQGSMALYYFSRARLVRDYVAGTPEWIIKLQEAGFAM